MDLDSGHHVNGINFDYGYKYLVVLLPQPLIGLPAHAGWLGGSRTIRVAAAMSAAGLV
jgi:hypothetical protein